jgi:hypothetical protein
MTLNQDNEFAALLDILCQSADDFLIHQFHLNRSLVLDKLDGQAVKIHRQRPEILSTLKIVAPKFVRRVETSLVNNVYS